MVVFTINQINMHKCNICENEMKAVDDINLKGFVIHGWRCECGNSISIRLPKVIADLYHLNASLKLPIETEPGGIRLKIGKRKMEA